MSILEKAKDFGGVLLGLVVIGGMMLLGITVLYGAAELSVWALEWTPTIVGWAFWLTILLLVPLALIPSSRGISGLGFVMSSYAFGIVLWIFSMAFTYEIWGLFAVIVGLFLFGVGVVPVAIIAAIFNGLWGVLGNIALLIVATFLTRFVGYWLIEKAEQREMRLARETMGAEKIKPAKRLD